MQRMPFTPIEKSRASSALLASTIDFKQAKACEQLSSAIKSNRNGGFNLQCNLTGNQPNLVRLRGQDRRGS